MNTDPKPASGILDNHQFSPDDVAGIRFEDLFSLGEIQRLQDEFASATGVASIITRADGSPITRPSNFCRLCSDIIRKTSKGLANCYHSNAMVGRLSPHGPTIQPCMSGGLWDAGAAISVGGQHIATWLIGQVRDDTQTEEKIRAHAPEIGADENEMAAAFREVPSMSRHQFGKIAQMLFTLASHLSNMAFQTVQQARLITELQQAEATLQHRVAYLQLIAEISSELAKTDSRDFTAKIDHALLAIGEFTRADRAYIVQFDEKGFPRDAIREWCAEGIPPHQLMEIFPKVDKEDPPWIAQYLDDRKVLHVPDVKSLPPEAWRERNYFESQGIKSILAVPIEAGKHRRGFLGINAVTQNRNWSDEDKNLLRFIGNTIYQVFERSRGQKQQEHLQAQLANTIEMANLGPWEYDVLNDRFFFNDHFYKMFHTTADHVGGYIMPSAEYARRFLHPEDAFVVSQEIEKGIKTKDPGFSQQLEHRIIYPDGKVGFISVRYFIEKDAQGRTVKTYGVNQEITERKEAEIRLRESEEKLARSQKMESLGLLAGGVAHDLNNILSGIISYPELILLNLPADSELRKPIETMQACGNRAAAIVQDLLTVTRGVAIEKQSLNLNDVIRDYLKTPEHEKLLQYYNDLRITVELDPHLFNIMGSTVHIGKAIMNLISNAAEAIKDHGNVTISTISRYLDQPLKGYDDVNIGEYAVLKVVDNGLGIPPQDLERIFEPFYSKKVIGRSGTGLGLAVVWNVVQDHHGYINVTSDATGTTFELYFPITREEIAPKTNALFLKDYQGRRETVLVVDDEQNQREIFCKMLEILNYNPQAVHNGEAAIAYMEKNSVDILLLDMIMGNGINGRETYEKILKMRPGQKAIIVSGYAETDEVKIAQQLGAGPFVKKPVQLEKIGLALKAELAK